MRRRGAEMSVAGSTQDRGAGVVHAGGSEELDWSGHSVLAFQASEERGAFGGLGIKRAETKERTCWEKSLSAELFVFSSSISSGSGLGDWTLLVPLFSHRHTSDE